MQQPVRNRFRALVDTEPVGRVGAVVGALPDRLPLVLLGFVAVATVLVLGGWFHWWLLLPLGALASAGAWAVAARTPVEVDRRTRNGAIAALIIAVVFVAGNAPFASQLFDVLRDPAIYTLEGVWLAHSPHVGIDVNEGLRLVKGLDDYRGQLGVFSVDSHGDILSQGGDALPSMLAIGAWIGGLRGLTTVNVVLGGLGLLSVYGLGRRVLGPIWALVPMVTLGISMPYMYFSRAPYSEIIMVVVATAGLTYLIVGLRSGRWTDLALSGGLLGSATMARVDGTIAVLGAMAVLVLAGLGVVSARSRRSLLGGGIAFTLAACASTALGAADLLINKPSYIGTISGQAHALWAATVGAGVFVALASVAGRWTAPRIGDRFSRRLGWILGALTLVLLLFWLSRPLWYVGEFQGAGTQGETELLQKAAGLPQDGERSYEEQTLAWLGWYFGWPMVAAAIVGFAAAVVEGFRRRRVAIVAIVGTSLGAALVYFDRVSITPDQVWAFRRILPMVTPGFLIVATGVAAWTWARGGRWPRIVGAALGVLVLTGPLWVANGLVLVRDGSNQRAEISDICGAIDAPDVLYITDGGQINYAMTLRTVCDVTVVSAAADDLDRASLATLRKRAGGDVDVVTFNRDAVPAGSNLGEPIVTTVVQSWNRGIDTTPNQIVSNTRSAWVGELDADGTVQQR